VTLTTTPTLSPEQAKALTEEVRADVAALWAKVLELYEGGAHVALGYGSWRLYWASEFGGQGARGEQLVRAGRVARALSEAGLPAPANDSVARKLTPVLRHAPDELPVVWGRAVEAHGTPTGREVEALVKPYREQARHARPALSETVAASYEQRGQTRHQRSVVSHALADAKGAAVAADAALEDALATEPSTDQLQEWLDDAESAAEKMLAVVRALRAAV
jgi:hypothetical protein